jgi:CheY-like chemotaxis protein
MSRSQILRRRDRDLRVRSIDGPRPIIIIIIITGNSADAIRERAHEAGCAAVLWKPFSAETILALLAFDRSSARQTHT